LYCCLEINNSLTATITTNLMVFVRNALSVCLILLRGFRTHGHLQSCTVQDFRNALHVRNHHVGRTSRY